MAGGLQCVFSILVAAARDGCGSSHSTGQPSQPREDYAPVERAGRELHARGRRKAFSLDEMLQAYESIVGRVKDSYDETACEYLNDLARRGWLAVAWPLVTENVRQSRAADLRALDDRFRAATADDGDRSLGRFFHG